MLASTQESAISASPTTARPLQGGALVQKYGPVQPFANIGDDEDTLRLYFDISALSLKKRKAFLRNVTPNQKSALWRTHLSLFFLKQDLNDWQKAVILSAMALATPEYFGVRSTDPAWNAKVQEPTRLLEQQIFDAFSKKDAAKIFATLGDDALAADNSAVLLKSINPLSNSGPYKQAILTRLVAQDMELERSSCECATNSDYCGIWSACRGGSCGSTPDGCGTFWTYPCNGACR